LRLAPPVWQFKVALNSGRIGRVSKVHVTHHARHILSEAEWVTRSRPDGAIFENAIHFLDLVHFLLDLAVPLSLDASRFQQAHHRPVLTGFEMFASDASGSQVTIDFLQDSIAHSALPSRVYISASGADAELRFYPDGFRLLSGVVDPLHDIRAELTRFGGLARRLLRPRGGMSAHDVYVDSLLYSRARGEVPICGPASVLPGVATAATLGETWAASVGS
jgi:predicted dehydrogenase